jgi:hypothetical protein
MSCSSYEIVARLQMREIIVIALRWYCYLLLFVLVLMGIGGCASTDKFLENRVVCTISKDEAFVVSRWGPVGISSEIARADQEVICK